MNAREMKYHKQKKDTSVISKMFKSHILLDECIHWTDMNEWFKPRFYPKPVINRKGLYELFTTH